MNTKTPFPSFGTALSIVEYWVFITIVILAMAGASCLGEFGLSCQTAVSIALGWIVLCVVIALLLVLAAANLISDRPGE